MSNIFFITIFCGDSTDRKHTVRADETGRAEPRAQRRLYSKTKAPESKLL